MSLLQEAIRKAERARDEAQPRRAELSAVPLEIVPDPEPSPQALALEPAPSVEASTAPERQQPAYVSPAAEEVGAANPKLALHISLAAAGIAAIAAAVYFWIQLRPAPVAANPNPPRAVTAAPAASPTTAEPVRPSRDAALPGLPPSVPEELPRAEPVALIAAAPPAQPAKELPAQKTKPEKAVGEAALPQPPPRPSPLMRAAAVQPRVQSGYAAYQAGDLTLARAEYEQALRDDPSNRDALLGIAAIEARSGRFGQAESYYRRLLQDDPRDPHAHAGLLALRAQRLDPLQVESRIKTLLANDPEASVLHFSLGNQYARQGRWDEAQRAYAKAHAADPENPDFAFNRAVSLDHLHQRVAALEQYRIALELAGARSANFPLESAAERVRQLSR
ncbi:MAG TPA: tetratricopeptide repeat protein [Burkholderiales bacterium]|jgi:Tfp pilus assembly protein PilF|nr:tetratricopeptide repeat protein [Burkholderiales bacterium]